MFELLFRYPLSVFEKGEFVLLGSWPHWLLLAAMLVASAGLACLVRRSLPSAVPRLRGWRGAVIWALQSTLLAVILIMLWQPALLVSTAKPQQNIVAVLVDDSASMALADQGVPRLDQVKQALESRVLPPLGRRFQTRVYRFSSQLERLKDLGPVRGAGASSQVGGALDQLLVESSGLPLAAVILVSDGADTTGGIGLETIARLRAQRLAVHTVGVGRERLERDLEVVDVQMPARSLPGSRLVAQMALRNAGLAGTRVKALVREAGKVVASREITLAAAGELQTEAIPLSAGAAGVRELEFTVETVPNEGNLHNNSAWRVLYVRNDKPRILYFEGEPRWEFKFIRRALAEDRAVDLVTLLRTTQNKLFRQGISGPEELVQGFPARVEELFAFQALVIGNVELNTFTTAQQQLIREFVDRRGGGLLMMAGRAALSESGYQSSPLAEALPVSLPARRGTFQREPANAVLAPGGADSLICRLAESPAANAERWKKLPYLADFQDVGPAKPGATVLLEMNTPGRGTLPLLVTQNYGRGRSAVLASAGTWRWQMSLPLDDMTHEIFWQQLLRWLAGESPSNVVATTSKALLKDEGRVRLAAEVRDRSYLPAGDARVEARISGPGGTGSVLELAPDPNDPGQYSADWTLERPGPYLAEVAAERGGEVLGRDVVTVKRLDGVAELERNTQNRELLERLAAQTGGRYWTLDELGRLPEEVSYTEAGITVRETRELWNLPAVFLLLLGLRASEWLLRRRWGIV